MQQFDITLADGRSLHAYDTGPATAPMTVVWHHGTPNIGLPPEPLFPTSEPLGIRWIGYDRPGYGNSDPLAGRDVASAAGDVAALADALEIGQFAVMGHSGGTPHALACAALLPRRVTAVLGGSGLAPRNADGLDWFAGMAPSASAALRAADAGRTAREAYQVQGADEEPGFIGADWEALEGEWGWFGKVVGPALASGPGPQIDDDLAYVSPWGFDPSAIDAPALLFHGAGDRAVPPSHSAWLAQRIRGAELRIHEGEGHVSVLRHAADGLRWLAAADGAAWQRG